MNKYSSFSSAETSHQHSLETLELFYQYDDFMMSIARVADLGCGQYAKDMIWWSTRYTRDEDSPRWLKIKTTGFDVFESINVRQDNVGYQKADIEKEIAWGGEKFDVLWCHDTFQYLLNPYEALANWRKIAADDSMLVLIVPQTTNMQYNVQEFNMPNGHLYHHTLTSLIFMLGCAGWDTRAGFYKKEPGDKWLHIIAYNSKEKARDPRTTSWYDLADAGLLHDSAVKSINRYGLLRQQDLVVPWLDKSLTWMKSQ